LQKKKKIVQSEKFTRSILNSNLQKNKVRKKYAILVLFYSARFLEILTGACGCFQLFSGFCTNFFIYYFYKRNTTI